MKRINKYFIVLTLFLSGVFSVSFAEPNTIELPKQTVSNVAEATVVSPSYVVKNPDAYLNKTIKMNARFDKFTTVGLDYPPAMKKSEEYVGFMVYRDDTTFDIPLAEMKLFLKRTDAQNFVELKSKDKVRITGKVFSTALGDPWVDVDKLEAIK